MKFIIKSITNPLPGETVFAPIARDLAEQIADDFYDHADIVPMDGAGFGVKSRGNFVACIGTVNHDELGDCPAILHKTEPRRELQFLALPSKPAETYLPA